jgi:hypothetical protein
MRTNVMGFVVAAFLGTMTLSGGRADASPTVVKCGAGTHSVVTHPVVNGHRIRRVRCVSNAARNRAVATTGRTTVSCGAGTHAVVHHPTINGRRVRQVVCARG